MMNHPTTPIVVIGFLAGLLLSSPTQANPTPTKKIRRFALVVGANDGGVKRVRLRYANTDAKAFEKVLTDLGGVSKQDSLLITDASKDDLLNGFSQMSTMLQRAQRRDSKLELLFYYSGHSNETGLLLGEQVLTYKEIKNKIETLPAAVRIGILDSCASGTLVRTKGGKRTAPFLVDTSTNVRGYALLTSSSADEVAQESDRVGGSYFTHYLISGLRGAADTNRDGRVTLNESYAYAFDETLYRTESSQAGPQHPNYDFQLAGAGDLVLTDLRATNAILLLAPELEGRVFIRDKHGRLVAEINKPSRRPVKMGIAPGTYEITIDASGQLQKGTVKVASNSPTRITSTSLKSVSGHATVARGDDAPQKREDTAQPDDDEIKHRPVAAGFVPEVTTNGPHKTKNNFAINFVGVGYELDGFEAGFLGNIRQNHVHGVQAAMGTNHTNTLHGAQFSFVNISRENTRGFQGGLANIGHTTEGMQAGLINLNGDKFRGMQAGLANYTGDMVGMQGGLINLLTGEMGGFQGGMANYAGSLKGAQAGLVNVTGYGHKGTQAGLVNVAGRSTGAQVGLVNITTDELAGVQVGLINFAPNGMFAPSYWATDTAVVNVGLKMGGRYTYSTVGLSVNPIGDDEWMSYFAGFGLHAEFHPFWFETDAVCHRLLADYQWTSTDLDLLVKTRFVFGLRLFDQFSVYAGPVLNNLISTVRDDVAISKGLDFYSYTSSGGTNYQLSMGFLVGLQWEPQTGKMNSWRGISHAATQ